MATATTQDDDLLIITDEDTTSEANGDIEFSFDFGEENSEKQEAKGENVIQETTHEELPEISLNSQEDSAVTVPGEVNQSTQILEETIEAEQSEKADEFSFDLTQNDTQDINASVVEINPDSNQEEASISPLLDETVSEVETETSTDVSMNDILSGTISKLVSRQESISKDKSSKASKEEEIKSQIKELQSQVSELEADMKELDKESDKITANISELENMKLDPVKEHNSKRVTKK